MERSDNNMVGAAEHMERSKEKTAVEAMAPGNKQQNGLDNDSATSKNGRRQRLDIATGTSTTPGGTSTHKGGHSVIITTVLVCIVIGVVITVTYFFKGMF